MFKLNSFSMYWYEFILKKTLGVEYVVDIDQTLNTKFNHLTTLVPAATEETSCRFIGIGNGGFKKDDGEDEDIMVAIDHSPYQIDPYRQIPWLVRRAEEDISEVEREKYRFRIPLNIDNVDYIAYYLKEVTSDDITYGRQKISVVDGAVEILGDYTIPTDVIGVTPDSGVSGNTELTKYNSEYINDNITYRNFFSEEDFVEIKNACEVIFGGTGHSYISEIILYMGKEVLTNGTYTDINGALVSFDYTDLLEAQPVVYSNTFFDLAFNPHSPEDVNNLQIGFGCK